MAETRDAGNAAGGGVSRRQALATGGLGLLAAGGSLSLAAQAQQPGKPGEGAEKTITVHDATNVALTVSPDFKSVAMDLLGILWTIPIGGGPAIRLTGDFDDLGQPDWSPDGGRIAFQSYKTGNFKIWSVPAAGGELLRHTDGNFDDREPRWSPDGKTIAFASDRSEGRYAIHLLDVASGKVTLFSAGKSQDSEPCWSRDGKSIAYIADGTKVMLAPVAGGAATVAASIAPSPDRFKPSELHAPSFAPDGTLAYTRVDARGVTLVVGGKDMVAGEDLYPFRPAWLAAGVFLYGSGGKIRLQAPGARAVPVEFTAPVPVTVPNYTKKTRDFTSTSPKPVVGIVAPALSPDGRQIAFGALNDLYLMTIGSAPKKLVADGFYKVDPAWSPDGKWLAYATDRAGTMDLWLREMATGRERQLTNLPDQGAVSPAWSPDGKIIAFLDQEGALHTVEVAGGAVQKVYAGIWEPGRPSFGPGGKTIAYTAFKPASARYREGLSEILTVDRATGKGVYAPIAPGKSLGVRGVDGPVWSPDGTMFAYVFASTLWVAPVDETGKITGTPRQLNTEVTDAVSWSGDSKSILYLNNGKLKLIPATGGAAKTIPCALTWANAKPKGRTVVTSDRLWDAVGTGYTQADVVIDGNVIVGLAPKGSVTDANAVKVDGTGLTLMPGLIDMHTHRQMQGYNYGDRMGRAWLAMGITATRSPGAPAYHLVEDREAIQSGARIAARHYGTGEAVDGSRIFYNFMRPVTEPGQMELELERAKALDYDMIKTYVRMRHDVQAQVVKAAHRMGMHLSSHYHYPALHTGMDCMEHTGATNRYGYSRTITAQGGGYQDVNELFAAAKAGRTPTLFIASAMLGEDDGLAQDPRIKTLFPSWEYAKLMGRVKTMRDGDRTGFFASLQRQVDQIRMTMAYGGKVVSGTDAPIDLVAISLHLNLRGMERCGMSPIDTLLTATRNSGEFLNEPIGRIAKGMLADLILVDGDPLARVADAAAVKITLANGVVHTPESLMAPFAAIRPSAVHSHHLPALAADDRYFWQTAEYVESSRGACCADHHHPIMRA
ncbi:amidohydrolase family protein [Sphingomonas naphthae]|uniref:Amidohydrolase family protein n=1 Tax=Sphingomonas naphthae TaxID=1813468 RepID=A0ABY7TPN3_9SPHN|nr:amidohydrolase family protein [Sphingomonas naphthae]WCT73809.1 amidohydrolase family protein [Sphingomonas naphthae]